MELIDKQNEDSEVVEYLNESQLDEIVKRHVTAPVDDADRKLKMLVLSLVSDLRNARGDLHSTQEEIAKLKEELKLSDGAHEMAERDFERWKARAIQAEQERERIRATLMEVASAKIATHKQWWSVSQERNALLEGLKQIANYERDQYESPLYAYDNCKTISRSIIAKIEGK